jgi:hypothetical protein
MRKKCNASEASASLFTTSPRDWQAAMMSPE